MYPSWFREIQHGNERLFRFLSFSPLSVSGLCVCVILKAVDEELWKYSVVSRAPIVTFIWSPLHLNVKLLTYNSLRGLHL